ncbi:MAG: hypothetical protein HQL19_00190 [Candidatus Omnitrophica bacterium]|nr:hypothetical protein [Candidatus Omnitrophota bacterium]
MDKDTKKPVLPGRMVTGAYLMSFILLAAVFWAVFHTTHDKKLSAMVAIITMGPYYGILWLCRGLLR